MINLKKRLVAFVIALCAVTGVGIVSQGAAHASSSSDTNCQLYLALPVYGVTAPNGSTCLSYNGNGSFKLYAKVNGNIGVATLNGVPQSSAPQCGTAPHNDYSGIVSVDNNSELIAGNIYAADHAIIARFNSSWSGVKNCAGSDYVLTGNYVGTWTGVRN